MMTNAAIIGRNVATLREAGGLSQTHLAELTGILRVNLSRLEDGHVKVSCYTNTLLRIGAR